MRNEESLDSLHEKLDALKLRTMVDSRDEEAWNEIKIVVNKIKNYNAK